MMISIKSIFFQTLFIKIYSFKSFIDTFNKILAEYHGDTMHNWVELKI